MPRAGIVMLLLGWGVPRLGYMKFLKVSCPVRADERRRVGLWPSKVRGRLLKRLWCTRETKMRALTQVEIREIRRSVDKIMKLLVKDAWSGRRSGTKGLYR